MLSVNHPELNLRSNFKIKYLPEECKYTIFIKKRCLFFSYDEMYEERRKSVGLRWSNTLQKHEKDVTILSRKKVRFYSVSEAHDYILDLLDKRLNLISLYLKD